VCSLCVDVHGDGCHEGKTLWVTTRKTLSGVCFHGCECMGGGPYTSFMIEFGRLMSCIGRVNSETMEGGKE
jgi:hypothetical protein